MNIELNRPGRIYWTQQDLSFTNFQRLKTDLQSAECIIPNQFVRILQQTQNLPDPYIDNNYEVYLEYEHHHLWYEFTFDLDEDQTVELNSVRNSTQGKIFNIIFDGIDTISEIWFNNKFIGHSDNMFVQRKFRIKDLLQPLNNSIVVHILHLPPENETIDPNLALTMKGWAIRKPQHMFGWDILPRLLSGGLFQPIRIVSESIPEINSIWIETIDVQADNARMRVGIALSPLDQGLLDSNLFRIDLQYQAPESHEIVKLYDKMEFNPINNIAFFEFIVSNPILWFPWTLGTPNLYSASLLIKLKPQTSDIDEVQSDVIDLYKKELSFGIRKITFDESERPDGGVYFRFLINDLPLFALGTNWVPLDALHLPPPNRQIQALEMVQDLGCNMIRVWGGGIYPLADHEEFYSWCDSHGILIWQDFMMACGVYKATPEFTALLEQEISPVMNRIRGHPSLFFLSGDNENESDRAVGKYYSGNFESFNPTGRSIIPRLLQKIDVRLPYIPSSPYNPQDWTYPSNHVAGDCHLWHHGYPFMDKFYFGEIPSFISEIGHISFPSMETIMGFLSPNEINNIGSEAWMVHIGEVPALLQNRNRLEKTKNSVIHYFASLPSDLHELIRASQYVQAEALKYWIEMARVHQDICRGIIWWNLLDGWPQCSDAIVDYYLRKKIAYSVVKCSQQAVLPVALPDNSIWIANNSIQKFNGKLTVKQISLSQADHIDIFETEVEIDCNQSIEISGCQIIKKPMLLIMKLSPSSMGLSIYNNYKILVGDSISFEDYQTFMNKLIEDNFLL